MVKEKANGLDREITKRLNKGQGRFQVFLNLIAASKPSMSQRMYFEGSQECKSCSPASDYRSSYLYCNMEDCKSSWAHQCLHNTARIAACFTVEFNYRMTSSYAEVLEFLRENNYPNQEVDYGKPRQRQAPARGFHPYDRSVLGAPRSREETQPSEPEVAAPVAEENDEETGGGPLRVAPLNERCVARMPQKMTHLRRYCTIFWNAKLCCAHCDTVCDQ
ncbi:unnamed protein product, partial [Mesorhabditis spiculigera]